MWYWLIQMMPEKVPHAQKPLQRAKRGQSLALPSQKQNTQAGRRAHVKRKNTSCCYLMG